MLTNLDMSIFKSRAERLPDRALALAIQTAIRQQHHERILQADTQRIDAWVTALKLEQARRSGRLHSLDDETEISQRWPAVGQFLKLLRSNEVDASIQIHQITGDDCVVASLQIHGPIDRMNEAVSAIQEAASETGSTLIKVQSGGGDV